MSNPLLTRHARNVLATAALTFSISAAAGPADAETGD